MKIIDTNLQDVKLVETDVFGDHRGFFTETYTQNKFQNAGINVEFTQDNQSLSVEPGVLRGMHYQLAPYAQTKLLRAVTGVIYDVLVDIRKGSPTYSKWEGYILSEYNHRQLLVPKGFAHGFVTLTPNVNVAYKVDGYYAPEADGGIAYDDPDIGIEWPMPLEHLILSDKDTKHPRLKDAKLNFVYGEGK
ncbi:dtdp-4-dehydrorhamnose 3,5-epimerase [Liquorilactobacillus capillatus DSM 19910]|uniref:dTDP-4-dehydrorhamnose 3,5-epimerase n=1 Tax=Liquorilactobacillus capillatus DSM 19910 TaxID=1423731 RepID=A0A0R1MEE6_9LACO|nr:dTDP-4-dehydrorhamnose 3,5-epimerase [Liquorilactobacillus capillatus]KRL02595.1 dtdp-4-dehydrorhamnose 3,5-epimerase [Liquorilactobacillus capillatus DSM 19910]